MKKILLALFVITSSNYIKAQGFTSPALQWNIPIVTDDTDYRAAWDYHQLIDMDGDGKIDLVDTENQATESIADVFMNGSQKYWKVYLGNGTSFAPTAIQWNIPINTDTSDYRMSWDYHTVIDMNGDGKPDFVDTENQATESVADVFMNGSQKYWRVYLNTGSGFSATPTQWNIPINTDTSDYRLAYDYHTVIDMNGDNKPDFVDTENEATESTSDVFMNGSQKYWKVYLNNGAGFDAVATQWNIPINTDTSDYRLAYDYHTVIDMNGDNKPDFVDTENQATESVADVFMNGSQKYWRVYLNTGSGFSATPTQWNIPINTDTTDYRLAYDYHTVIDMNGDRKPDFVDTENEATESIADVFVNSGQKYWKVYLNTGSGFAASATQWNIPIVSDSSDYRLAYDYHTVIDMNGDRKPDFVDTENEATESIAEVFMNGGQKYWKVYLNNAPNLGNSEFEGMTNHITVYPNPVKDTFKVTNTGTVTTMKMYDIKGTIVKEIVQDFDNNIDISNLPKGIYLLKVTNAEGQVLTQRLAKE
ncbi:T9SS type A sorting domain-containing protein [Flavobacterium silvisoli]|uniref:T9SS type A sorting domain-containing protein n=1 Tax=Flavobacterium silvisoli TaxID=2529433 RepID=A0A4Q9YZ72_9FLAO|nr:T9SS type A sorting domain-containing protein [Flavobacterium silvisoli]TBX69157.1 T9SS type A sorting domain-containing protein [Flavobacterium silvisoli]